MIKGTEVTFSARECFVSLRPTTDLSVLRLKMEIIVCSGKRVAMHCAVSGLITKVSQ